MDMVLIKSKSFMVFYFYSKQQVTSWGSVAIRSMPKIRQANLLSVFHTPWKVHILVNLNTLNTKAFTDFTMHFNFAARSITRGTLLEYSITAYKRTTTTTFLTLPW